MTDIVNEPLNTTAIWMERIKAEWRAEWDAEQGAATERLAVLTGALRKSAEVLDQSGGDRYAIEARGILRAALAGEPNDG